MLTSAINFKEIEYAGFRSLPAEQQLEFDGIVLRFNSGYTKRANSASILLPQKDEYSNLVQQCEQLYQAKDLPCIFRLPSFAQNQQLDNYLAKNGYQYTDHSLVLYRSLQGATFINENLSSKQPLEWLQSYCRISQTDINHQQPQVARLNRINDKLFLAVLSANDQELACGLSVISNKYCGIFNVVTKKTARNKGIGSKLLNGMLCQAVINGATEAYIQVVSDNIPAINLYKKLGYQYAYEYHYRVKTHR